MVRWLMAIGSSVVFAAGGWVAGQAGEGPMSGINQGPPPEHHHREHVPMELETITGKVASQTTAPNGEVDGVKLEDGTWVHWPPHLEKYLGKLTQVGQEVAVEGRRQAGPLGEPVLELAALTNVEEKSTFQRELSPPPPPGGPMGGPCPPPHPPGMHPPGQGPAMGGHPGGGHPGVRPHAGMQPPRPPRGHGTHQPHGPQGMRPPEPNGHQPPEGRMKQLEDRLQRIEEQLGRLIDQA